MTSSAKPASQTAFIPASRSESGSASASPTTTLPAAERFLALQEIVAAARRNLAPGPWTYLFGGTETETTVRRNRHALDSLAFRPRVLNDVSRVDTRSTFMGKPVRLPVMIAPVGGMESFVAGGAATAAQAAAQFGVPQMLSAVASRPG